MGNLSKVSFRGKVSTEARWGCSTGRVVRINCSVETLAGRLGVEAHEQQVLLVLSGET